VERWESGHRSNKRLADGDYIGLVKQSAEGFPVFFVAEGINVRSYGLVDIHSQRSVKLFGDSRHIR
jgi:hypothetical protein